MGPPHEESIRRPIAPWANALTTELHLAPPLDENWDRDWEYVHIFRFHVRNATEMLSLISV